LGKGGKNAEGEGKKKKWILVRGRWGGGWGKKEKRKLFVFTSLKNRGGTVSINR